jgi:hypothetical protein
LKAPNIPAPKKLTPEPQDTMNWGCSSFKKNDLVNFGAGAAVGAIGIGTPAGLGLGCVKAFASGNYALGAGLGLAAAGTAALTVVPSLAVAAMSSDGGDSNGIRGFFVGAALSTAAAATILF